MEITTAVLADAANISQEGKLNITGIFDSIAARTFPAKWPLMVLVIRIEAHGSETGQHDIRVRLIDEDGTMLSQLDGAFDIGRPDSPHLPVTGELVLRIANSEFSEPGTYSFDIWIDGRYEQSAQLHVLKLQG